MTDQEIIALLSEAFVHVDPAMTAFASELTPATSLRQIDSVVLIGVVGYVEERLEGEVEDDALQTIYTVADFVKLVKHTRIQAIANRHASRST